MKIVSNHYHCPECGTAFKLENGDRIYPFKRYTMQFCTYCPTCSATVPVNIFATEENQFHKRTIKIQIKL